MSRLTPVDTALARILGACATLPAESVNLGEALGRVLAEPVASAHALPLFDQSSVDGYAVRRDDLAKVPALLPLSAVVAATGHDDYPQLRGGTAARILTGGLLPLGADTVVRQELTRREGDHIAILETVPAGTDIRRAGEELAAGAQIAGPGRTVTPGLTGALAVAGVQTVRVRRQPRVVVLVTGDEVVAAGAALRLGQVPDANGPLLAAHLRRWQCPPLRVEYVADTEDAVRDALQRAFADADIVLTTGGVSVGDYDFIPSAAEAVGAERLLWKVAQKPGMPLYVARCHESLLFGLPGNPASVLVNLQVYVRSALDALSGRDPAQRWRSALAPKDLRRESVKTLWLRACAVDDGAGGTRLQPLRGQASHMLGNLAQANALARVPAESESGSGDVLRWLPLDA